MGFPTYIVLSPEHTEVVFGSRRNKHLTIKTQIGTCQSPKKPFFRNVFPRMNKSSYINANNYAGNQELSICIIA